MSEPRPLRIDWISLATAEVRSLIMPLRSRVRVAYMAREGDGVIKANSASRTPAGRGAGDAETRWRRARKTVMVCRAILSIFCTKIMWAIYVRDLEMSVSGESQ